VVCITFGFHIQKIHCVSNPKRAKPAVKALSWLVWVGNDLRLYIGKKISLDLVLIVVDSGEIGWKNIHQQLIQQLATRQQIGYLKVVGRTYLEREWAWLKYISERMSIRKLLWNGHYRAYGKATFNVQFFKKTNNKKGPNCCSIVGAEHIILCFNLVLIWVVLRMLSCRYFSYFFIPLRCIQYRAPLQGLFLSYLSLISSVYEMAAILQHL